jgi:hypothetical protein
MVTYAIEGGTRTRFTDCECQEKPETRRSSRFTEPAIKFRHGMKGDCRDYRDDLARFAGDPEAYVDGPAALQKLIDKRKRQGWQMSRDFSSALGEGPNPDQTTEEMAREAYERARAKGFTPEE